MWSSCSSRGPATCDGHATGMRRFSEAVHTLSGLRLEELHVVCRAPRQSRVYGRQRVCPRDPVSCRRRGFGGLQAETAQRPRQGGNVPCRGGVCVARSSEHVLQHRPHGIVMSPGICRTRRGGHGPNGMVSSR